MGNQTKLKQALDDLVDTKVKIKKQPKFSVSDQELKLKTQKIKAVQKNSKLQKEPLVKSPPPAPKNTSQTKTKSHRENVMDMVAARKVQMLTKSGVDPFSSPSPLQMHLIQSESLRIAQDKLTDLEMELNELRQKNEAIVSASSVLKDKNDFLKTKLEDLKYNVKEEKNSYKDEKEVLLSALEEAKTQINQLKNKTHELETRLSSDLYGIRNRENSLESRIEILKMENSVLQREKDKKIIEQRRQIQNITSNLDGVHKKNQDLKTLNSQLQENSSRTVSVLRATIYNLEGMKAKDENTAIETSNKLDNISKGEK